MEANERYQLNGASFEDFRKSLDFLSSIEVPEVSSFDELIEFYQNEYLKLLVNKNWEPNFKRLNWYNLDGKTNSMRDLVNAIGLKDSEYELAYALPSTALHGTDIVRKIAINQKDEKIIYRTAAANETLKSIRVLLVLCLKNLSLGIAKFYGVHNDSYVKKRGSSYGNELQRDWN